MCATQKTAQLGPSMTKRSCIDLLHIQKCRHGTEDNKQNIHLDSPPLKMAEQHFAGEQAERKHGSEQLSV